MELKEIKRLTSYARKAGIKSLKINGLEIELYSLAKPAPTPQLPKASESEKSVEPPREATLQEINDWIYKQDDEAV